VGLLAVFQIALIATARSFVASGNFAWLTQMAAPSFVRNTFGAAFTSFAGMSVLGFFEPLIIILVVQFAIYLATEPAGEIESGLLTAAGAAAASRADYPVATRHDARCRG
jgi:hypothetical protein